MVVGGHHGDALVADGEDGVGVVDADAGAVLDLHTAVGVVDGLDEAKVFGFEELGDDDLAYAGFVLDCVAHYLGGVSL